MILPTVFHWGYMLLNPLGDIFVYKLNLRIGHCVYGLHVVHRGSLEQVLFSRFNTATIVLKDIDWLDFYPNYNFIPKFLY